jgi:hypothetical protein
MPHQSTPFDVTSKDTNSDLPLRRYIGTVVNNQGHFADLPLRFHKTPSTNELLPFAKVEAIATAGFAHEVYRIGAAPRAMQNSGYASSITWPSCLAAKLATLVPI